MLDMFALGSSTVMLVFETGYFARFFLRFKKNAIAMPTSSPMISIATISPITRPLNPDGVLLLSFNSFPLSSTLGGGGAAVTARGSIDSTVTARASVERKALAA